MRSSGRSGARPSGSASSTSPPGGADVVARVIAQPLTERLREVAERHPRLDGRGTGWCDDLAGLANEEEVRAVVRDADLVAGHQLVAGGQLGQRVIPGGRAGRQGDGAGDDRTLVERGGSVYGVPLASVEEVLSVAAADRTSCSRR